MVTLPGIFLMLQMFVISLNPDLPVSKPSWRRQQTELLPPPYHFVTPAITAIEWVVVVTFLFWFCRKLTKGVSESELWKVSIPARPAPEAADSCGPKLLRVADVVLRVICLVCCVLTVYYKVITDRKVYLLQPCHLSNFALGLLCFYSPRRHGWAAKLFYANLTTAYGTLIACLAPDTSSLKQPGEVAFFHTQHYMLLLLPCVWLIRRRAPLFRSFRLDTLLWAQFALLHWLVFAPASILRPAGRGVGAGANVNYMLMPPSVYPTWFAPEFYRPITLSACLLLTWLTRYLLVDAVVGCSGVTSTVEAEAAADAEFLLLAKASEGAEKKRASTSVRSRGPAKATPIETVTLSSSPIAQSPAFASPAAVVRKTARAASPKSTGRRR